MKSEKNARKAERAREEVKDGQKRPYARPRLTSYGMVERLTGGQLS